jgi:hypothetical protein
MFGHNAPDRMLIEPPQGEWDDLEIRNDWIELDASYPKVIPGSWVALVRPPDSEEYPEGYVELYKPAKVSFPSRAAFGLSGKTTRIEPDITDRLQDDFFKIRDTVVFAQAERLQIAQPPLRSRPSEAPSSPIPLDDGVLAPVESTRITLDRQVSELPPGKKLILTGKRIRAKVSQTAPALTLANDAGTISKALKPGQTLIVLHPPAVLPSSQVSWRLLHPDGFEGTLTTALTDLLIAAAEAADPEVSEQVSVLSSGNPAGILLAGGGLKNTYDRTTIVVQGNVAAGTHGETVEEFAGSGDATRVFQKFTLRQPPLTYVRAENIAGMASTLEVRVDDLLWREAPFFYGRTRDERIYITRLGDEQKTTVTFGDGINAARLSTGQHNVRFKYRKGSGLEGMVRAGQLTQLLTRPLGVKEVTNPLAAEGADEAESLKDARANAPVTVLTLERLVSLQDYEDFARAYPGIAKALATWTWDGRSRGVLLTLAGPKGIAIDLAGFVAGGLQKSMRDAGDPFVPVHLKTCRMATFELGGRLTVHPDYETPRVLAAARQKLRDHFSFEKRQFGQPVFLSEVIGLLHSVAGVVGVDLDHLQRSDISQAEDPAPRLLAEFPGGGADTGVEAAELLILAPGDLEGIEAAT